MQYHIILNTSHRKKHLKLDCIISLDNFRLKKKTIVRFIKKSTPLVLRTYGLPAVIYTTVRYLLLGILTASVRLRLRRSCMLDGTVLFCMCYVFHVV